MHLTKLGGSGAPAALAVGSWEALAATLIQWLKVVFEIVVPSTEATSLSDTPPQDAKATAEMAAAPSARKR
ncbi:unannotated protein [freshwater metagenome]|uniref:Unannotated protein n=1 Tax=freshwater metagenome TaxID=449393 RepID=A0A6J5ZWT3_9ZZZZ